VLTDGDAVDEQFMSAVHVRSVKVAVKHIVLCISFLSQLLFEHTDLYKDTGYSDLVQALVLQLNRTETVEQKYVIDCDDENSLMWKVSLKWNGTVGQLLIECERQR